LLLANRNQSLKIQDKPQIHQWHSKLNPFWRGETVKLQVNLPECKGNTCPDFTVERLQSNFPFIDSVIGSADSRSTE
jgi:hypothetical protein